MFLFCVCVVIVVAVVVDIKKILRIRFRSGCRFVKVAVSLQVK